MNNAIVVEDTTNKDGKIVEQKAKRGRGRGWRKLLAFLLIFALLASACFLIIFLIKREFLPWENITEGQATVLAAAVTFMSAILISTLGPLLFDNALDSIRDASEEAELAAEKVEKRLRQLDIDIATFSGKLIQIQDALGEQNERVADDDALDVQTLTDLREHWHDLKGVFEELAVDPSLTPNKQTRLWRIDRRSYGDLIDRLIKYQQLNGVADQAQAAVSLWLSFRNGRNSPTNDDLALMIRYKAVITQHLEQKGWDSEDGWYDRSRD